MKEDRFRNHSEGLSTTESITWRRTTAEGNIEERKEDVIVEQFTEVSVNGVPAFTLACTPVNLTELVVGKLFTEGLINGVDDIESLFICGEGNIAEVILKESIDFKPFTGTEPSCCAGNKQYVDGVRKLSALSGVELDSQAVFELAQRFSEDSKLHKSTNGTHSCYIRFEDGSIEAFEDISRHNALDKAVGYMLLQERAAEHSMLYTTGRIAADMVIKTVAAGIPVLVSKSVPTTKALSLSREYNLKLICKAWPDSYSESI